MKFSIILFKDSSCELCRLMQQELIDNPPNADLKIVHVSRENCSNEAIAYGIEYYPTTVLIDETGTIINRFEGFIDSKSINVNIDKYETECLVQVSKPTQV